MGTQEDDILVKIFQNFSSCNGYKWGRVIDFGNLLLYSPNTLPLGILEKLKLYYNQKKEEITTPTTDVSA